MKTRNSMVPAMIGRHPRTQVHKPRWQKGGDRNLQAEFLAEADGELGFVYDWCYDDLEEYLDNQ